MRIIGFSERWSKLSSDYFTTFRFPRKDKDWQVGEIVQVYYKPLSKEREYLGIAIIVSKVKRSFILSDDAIPAPTISEAISDGFKHSADMEDYFINTYHGRIYREPMNKLTLYWKSNVPSAGRIIVVVTEG
jgi:hypothetical protein